MVQQLEGMRANWVCGVGGKRGGSIVTDGHVRLGRWVLRATKSGMSGVIGTRMGRSPAVIYTLEPFPVLSCNTCSLGVSIYGLRQ